MNELHDFIANKGLEKAKLDVVKKAICEDTQLSDYTKKFWIKAINNYSAAKDIYDVLEILKKNN